MNRNELIDLIISISKQSDAFEILEREYENTSVDELRQVIIECGIMPEVFSHDSSQEKLWAKYSDIMLSICLIHLGISSDVLRTRGDSADVFGKTSVYSIVGDAKTFRLSRTAKNQKDFKIKALDDWRRSNDFALLAGPLNQYLSNRSQIYQQAIERNVTLISYVHLNYMLKHYTGKEDLYPLWMTGKRLSTELPKKDHRKAPLYWREIDRVVCEIFNTHDEELDRIKDMEIDVTRKLGLEGIQYWESKVKEYMSLSKEEAIRHLIKADKIEAKIEQIRKAISKGRVL